MKDELDKLSELFVGADVNGRLEQVLFWSDFQKIYRSYDIMNEPLTDARLEHLEKRTLNSENIESIKSIVHQLIASHRLLRIEIAKEKLKTNAFKQKMESIVKEL